MGSIGKLSDFLASLDFLGARSGREFLGSKEVNPAMVIEESVPVWSQASDMEDIEAAFVIFKEKVCVLGFPARYSPAFWLAHAALTAMYKVLSAHLHANFTQEVLTLTNQLLFDLWVTLTTAGPGSSHLEMMDVILKNEHFLLWKYMASLHGEHLQTLISTLKTDFVYDEDVPSDHYATLMETHVDKIFRHILTVEQYDKAHRGMLDLYVYYLGRMNHVPPHIGPRLSHLCFLICQKYELENPYLGLEDWVVMRHHLKVIKDIVTDHTFTLASEAQYRAPITLEKVFQAAISDNMLELLFKEFMLILTTICNNNNSKKSRRLFGVYQMALFRSLELDKWKELPTWMFEPCITTMAQVVSTNSIGPHIEEMFDCALNECLLKFTTLSRKDKEYWHRLLVNCVVSGRRLLVTTATHILAHPVLFDAGLFQWKLYVKEAKMLVDIVADLPTTFMQDDEGSPLTATVDVCAKFLSCLLAQLQESDMVRNVMANVQTCVIKCVEKGAPVKASIALMCLNLDLLNFKDMDFIQEILFSVEQLLRDPDCPYKDKTFSEVVERLLVACLGVFRDKGYIPVDFNSLFASICLSSLYEAVTEDEADQESCDTEQRSCDTEQKSCDTQLKLSDSQKTGDTQQKSGDMQKSSDTQKKLSESCDGEQQSCDLYKKLYSSVVQPFVSMHQANGTVSSIATFVPNIVQLIQEYIVHGTSITRCVQCLHWLGTSCPLLITDHVTSIMELFLDWNCYSEMIDLMKTVYPLDNLAVSARLSDMFDKLAEIDREDRHCLMAVIASIAEHQTQLISVYRVTCLLNMYAYESSATQRLILEITGHVARHHPEFLASHYTLLTDDTKFTAHSMSVRAPILAQLAQLGEEQSRKTIDYLLKHITSKDPAVAVPTIDVLGPLLKDNPQYLQKQKQKVKAAWKATSIAEVKDFCLDVLPEIQISSKGNVVKPLPKDDSRDIKSTVESKQGNQVKKANATPQTKTVRQSRKSLEKTTSTKLKSATPLRTSSSLELHKSTKSPKTSGKANNLLADTGHETTGDGSDARGPGKERVDGKGEKESIHQKSMEVNKQSKVEKVMLSKIDRIDHSDDIDEMNGVVPHGNIHERDSRSQKKPDVNLPKQQQIDTETPQENNIHHREEQAHNNEIQLPNQQAQVKKEIVAEDLKQHSNANKLPETVEILDMDEHSEDTDNSSKSLVNRDYSISAPVYLCYHSNSREKVSLLRRHLQMAGYECRTGTEETGSGGLEDSGIDGAKIVIVCLTHTFVQTAECCYQVQRAIEMDKPLVPVLLSPVSQSDGSIRQLLGTRLCIRFYTKPSEEAERGIYWPAEKFHEVLMQLNYLGILRNEKHVSAAYRNWWLPAKEDEPVEARETDESLVSTGAADVFISYQWGAHCQAVSLFRRLTNLGYMCWLGIYRMGGSESLYNKIVQGLHGCRVVVACITNKFELAENCQQEVIIAHALKRPIIPLVLDSTSWPIGGKVAEILSNHETAIMFESSGGKHSVNWSGENFEKLIKRLNKHTTLFINISEDHIAEHSATSRSGDFVNVKDNGDATSDGKLSLYETKQEVTTTNASADRKSQTTSMRTDSEKSMQNLRRKKSDVGKNSQSSVDKSLESESQISQRVNSHKLKKSSSLIVLKNVSHDFLAPQLITSKTDDDLIIVRKGYQDGILVDKNGYTLTSSRSKSCAIV